jgi:hypothetical protein
MQYLLQKFTPFTSLSYRKAESVGERHEFLIVECRWPSEEPVQTTCA